MRNKAKYFPCKAISYMELNCNPPDFLSKDNSCLTGSIIWQMKEKVVLYFRPGGPVVAGICTSGFIDDINLYHDKQDSRERGRHRFLWEQFYGARWQYAVKCRYISSKMATFGSFFSGEWTGVSWMQSSWGEHLHFTNVFWKLRCQFVFNDYQEGGKSSSNIGIGGLGNRGLIWQAEHRHPLQSEMLQVD